MVDSIWSNKLCQSLQKKKTQKTFALLLANSEALYNTQEKRYKQLKQNVQSLIAQNERTSMVWFLNNMLLQHVEPTDHASTKFNTYIYIYIIKPNK
jgi:membrane carboxypeptidase/penicillin-binding protein PbpC